MRDISDYSQKYFKHPFEDIQIKYRKRKVLDLLNNYSHSRILEIGCGMDPFFNYFIDFEKLVIVEPSLCFYKNALSCINLDHKLSSKVDIINDYFEDSINKLRKYNFDFIIISCLLHEIENVELFLEKIRSFITSKTIVHIDVPNAQSFHRILALEMGLINSVYVLSESNLRFQQQKVYDLASLSKLITNHDFDIIDSGSYFIKLFTHKQMANMIEHNIIDEKVLDGLYRLTKYMPDLGSEIFINFKLK